eukprot:COSAG01_NODE_4712_length_4798_cov_3.005959_1_plen_105_part_00
MPGRSIPIPNYATLYLVGTLYCGLWVQALTFHNISPPRAMLLTAFSLVASGTLAAPLVDNRTSTRAEWELLPGFQTTVATGISFSSPTEGIGRFQLTLSVTTPI